MYCSRGVSGWQASAGRCGQPGGRADCLAIVNSACRNAASCVGVDTLLCHPSRAEQLHPLLTPCRMQVKCRDRRGLLSDIINALKMLPVEIRTAAVVTSGDGMVRDVFEIRADDPDLTPDAVQVGKGMGKMWTVGKVWGS